MLKSPHFDKMAAPGRKTEKGGFECEFVETPPKALQSECPVCLQVLREPHQVDCCASLFCRACIGDIKTEINRCPTCNDENFSTFHDKRLQRTLYEFQVYCSSKEEGCDWKGELGQLDNHLNLSPQPDKRLEGCKYSEIECIYCSESIKRSDITIHQGEHCDKRPFSCEYCYYYESHYEDVIHNHWPVCGYHPVHCPNECGELPQRQALENHIAEDCPKTVIDCDFCHVGCDVRLRRTDMPAHLEDSLVTHTSLQAASYCKLLERVKLLESENKVLKQQVGMPTASYVEFTMENFEQHKQNKDQWFSPPFYTHPGGYKLCLNVYANGYGSAGWFGGGGEGSYVTVGVTLMRGEFDNQLKFPIRVCITVQLVNQDGGEQHRTGKFDFTDTMNEDIVGRVTEGDRSTRAQNHLQFISHGGLKPNYLKNDRLRFRITKIKFNF